MKSITRIALGLCVLILGLSPIVPATAETSEIEVKLFVSKNIDGLDYRTCKLDDFGAPARLVVKSSEAQHTNKFDLPRGQHATMTERDGSNVDGCYYVFTIELPRSTAYKFYILDVELASVNYVIMSTMGEVNLSLTGVHPTTPSEVPSEPAKATKPVEPIAYAPDVQRVIQRSLLSQNATAGAPLVLVITSFEFSSEATANESFQPMCDDIAAWYISVSSSAYWRDVSVETDDVCGVSGTPEGEGSATILIRYGSRVLSFTTGGLDLNATAWLESFMAQYPYDPGVAIPATNKVPGNWTTQKKSSGDVTDIAITARNARP